MNRCTIIRGDSGTLVELDVRRYSEDNRAKNETAVGIIEMKLEARIIGNLEVHWAKDWRIKLREIATRTQAS